MHRPCRLAIAFLLPCSAAAVAAGWLRDPLWALAAIVGITAVGAWHARPYTTQLARATEVARRLAEGRFSETMTVSGAREWRDLARALNSVGQGSVLREEQLNSALDDAANQRDLFYSIINASSDGLLLYDCDRLLLAANLRCGELLGFTVHELLTTERRVLEASLRKRCDCPDAYGSALDRHFEHPDQPHQDQLVLREPRRRVLRRYSCPLVNQRGVQGRVFTYTDVTVEAEIDRMKSEFVSMTSHELRTPLTSVHGALQLALNGSGGRLAEEDRELLEISVANTERLVRLVNDLLDLSKIEAGRMPFVSRTWSVADLLEDAVRGLHGFAATRETRIVVATSYEGTVVGDRDQLLRVTVNLLGNALKYSPPGSSIRLGAYSTPNGVAIFVEDAGPGIPPDQVDRLFRPFSRVGAHERQTSGGTGLGLAISRAIVEQHGGRIWVERVIPSGSRFVFTLPPPPRPSSEAA